MAKKGDILLTIYNDFAAYKKSYNSRLHELERDFLHMKNSLDSYLQKVDNKYKEPEDTFTKEFFQIELLHQEKVNSITQNYNKQLSRLNHDIILHNQKTTNLYEDEDNVYQEILNQFEERKADAFNRYLELTRETNKHIDHEMKVHHDFITEEDRKLEEKQNEYQELNSNLSNQLIWTMEKAKNALNKLSASLMEEGATNRDYLRDVISESIEHLTSSKESMSALFRNTTTKFEQERNLVRSIAQNKRKPHSQLNTQMIHTFVKQIRKVNEQKIEFERMIKAEHELSLAQLYPKIIEADNKQDENELRKLILQKEIIEKKADYLLKRNQTMSDLLISKYQTEIKKIKIDSFKRSEEIKRAYSVPVAFFQNSVNVYSNFAFYLNETYEKLTTMLTQFKEFNSEYIDYKKNYIHGSQKTFEDYKINLLVKVNHLTNQLTQFISEIDQVSNEIVTLESNNRLEIAEIRKKMENLEIFGDYQKYLASLENDQYFAMYQHNQNITQIQVESNYTNNLLNINKEVLMLNQTKMEYLEYNDYMTTVAKHEEKIHELTRIRKIDEAQARFQQKMDQVLALSKLAHEKIIYHAKQQNFHHAAAYKKFLDETAKKEKAGSMQIIDFIEHAQELIDLNTKNTNQIKEQLNKSEDENTYLRILEGNRLDLLQQVDDTSEKKNKICIKAVSLYEEEISNVQSEVLQLLQKYLLLLKRDLIGIQKLDVESKNILRNRGYKNELLAVIDFVYQKLISLAYKYQIPDTIQDLEKANKKYLETFIIRNISIFNILDKSKKEPMPLMKRYLIETISLFEEYLNDSETTLETILKHITKNDRSFITNTKKKAEITKQMINREYDRLEYKAYRIQNAKEKQIKHLKTHAETINQVYKDQVTKINDEFLKRKKESKQIAEFIAKKYYKIIRNNNRELQQMLRFLEKMYQKEQKQLENQLARYKKALEHIEVVDVHAHKQELAHIDALYSGKENETNKTIALLENRINHLPVEKQQHYLDSKKEKYALVATKKKELQRQFAEIERDKFVSRPKYLEEIKEVKKRLPEDYANLYTKIQHLEFNYLNQFSAINEEYTNNYKEYLLNQSGNNEILDSHSKLYMPFNNIQELHERIIKSTTQAYLETIARSKKTREQLNKDVAESIEKQNRIINV